MSLSTIDRRWLERAATLGRSGWGRVHPNPMVGCVVVQDGLVVGEGWHAEFGGPHAEVVALRDAGDRAAGATAFVSLEPCRHHGKTPPCTEALARAGIARVVFGAGDPGAESGGGGAALREDGIEVVGPLWGLDRSRAENPAFFHARERRSPWIAIKLAQSRDGKIARGAGQRTQLTGVGARRWVHELRAGFDAVLVGSRTAGVDDPLLTVREGVTSRVRPARVVFDSGARLSADAKMLTEPGGRTIVVAARGASDSNVQSLRRAGAHVVLVGAGPGGVEISEALSSLWDLGIQSVLCEGGGALAGALLDAGAVERLYLLTAPVDLGEDGVPAFSGAADESIWRDWRPFGAPEWIGPDRLGVYRRYY